MRPAKQYGILGWVEVKWLGLGPVWIDEGVAQTQVFPMTKVFSSPAAPSVQVLRSLEGLWGGP